MGGDVSETTEEMRELVRPSSTQTIDLRDGEVDATDDRDTKLEFFTDGRKIQKSIRWADKPNNVLVGMGRRHILPIW